MKINTSIIVGLYIFKCPRCGNDYFDNPIDIYNRDGSDEEWGFSFCSNPENY